jgi:CrcB protein
MGSLMGIILLVGVGGFLGSVCRYLANREVQHLVGAPGFPYGTLAVNVIGCLLIGLLNGVAESRGIFNPDSQTRALVFIGFLGGFTTFSAFGYETFTLARDGEILRAFGNIALQIALGLGAVWVGHKLSSVFA